MDRLQDYFLNWEGVADLQRALSENSDSAKDREGAVKACLSTSIDSLRDAALFNFVKVKNMQLEMQQHNQKANHSKEIDFGVNINSLIDGDALARAISKLRVVAEIKNREVAIYAKFHSGRQLPPENRSAYLGALKELVQWEHENLQEGEKDRLLTHQFQLTRYGLLERPGSEGVFVGNVDIIKRYLGELAEKSGLDVVEACTTKNSFGISFRYDE